MCTFCSYFELFSILRTKMDKIADEIVLRIFCLLDIQDVINCRIVSKRFNRITEDSFIYK